MSLYAINLGAGPWLALAPGVLPELMQKTEVTALPNAGSGIAGLVSLRGTPLLVIDPAPALGLTPERGRKVLVLDRDAEAIAVLIEGEPRLIANIMPSSEAAQVPDALVPFVNELGRSELGVTALFDHRGFFAALTGVGA
jgi:chemotaxis signal transduction protein